MTQEENFDPFEETTDTPVEEVEEEVVEEPEEEPKGETEEEVASEKMIPESRLKAAIKDVQDKLDAALQENAKYKATPTPDREADPDGYEQHLRLEMSKALMREFKEDYVEVITHYQEMAKASPHLNDMVAKHELPAKLAYDIAKRDLEIRELTEARKSEEWKEFQEFKKNKGKSNVAEALALPASKAVKLPKNLNSATSAKPKADSQSDDDYLFGDSPL